MSSYNTNYSVNNNTTSSNVDLKNIFQINPNSPSITSTFFNPPYTISGTSPFIEYVSGWYILTFNSSSSITFDITTSVYVTIVGGGGGGGSSNSSGYASGGNGGSVCNASFSSDTNQITITVGSGGAGGTSGGNGSNGNISSISSSLININCPGGNHGVTGNYWPSGQTAVTTLGVTAVMSTQANSITGGNFPIGNKNNSGVYEFSNGINGIGVSIPPNSSRIEYFGGGGASCGTFCGGSFGFASPPSGGLGGGGNGGYNYNTSGNNYAFIQAGSGMNGRGGGGGADFYNSGQGPGGNGGNGCVIMCFKYP